MRDSRAAVSLNSVASFLAEPVCLCETEVRRMVSVESVNGSATFPVNGAPFCVSYTDSLGCVPSPTSALLRCLFRRQVALTLNLSTESRDGLSFTTALRILGKRSLPRSSGRCFSRELAPRGASSALNNPHFANLRGRLSGI